MDIADALCVLVDVQTGAKPILTVPEGEALKEAITAHYNPPPPAASAPGAGAAAAGRPRSRIVT